VNRRASAIVVAVSAAILWTGCPASAEGPSPESLVRRLASSSFIERASAEREILDSAESVYPILKAQVSSDDPELRIRAARLLKLVQRRVLERQFARFLETQDPMYAPPGWLRFSEVAGESPEAVKLYLAMFLANPDPLMLLAGGSDQLQTEFQALCDLVSHWQTDSQLFQLDSFATIVFLAGCPEIRLDRTSQQQVISLLNFGQVKSAIDQGEFQNEIRQIVSTWIEREDSGPPGTRFNIAHRFNLDAMLTPALQLLDSAAAGSVQRDVNVALAILCVAEKGSVENMAQIEPLLDETAKFHEWRQTNQGQTIHVTAQIRDVALLASIYLMRQQPAEFGFKHLKKNQSFLYIPNSAGFTSDDEREEAFARWSAWRSRNRSGLEVLPDQAVEGIGL
jgi:hypothetical protein